MIYCYFKDLQSKDNTDLIKKIKELDIDENELYIEETANSKEEFELLVRTLQPKDFLLIDSLLDLEDENPKNLRVLLKHFEDKGIEVISLSEPALSHSGTYSKLNEVLKLDKYYRTKIRENAFRKAVDEGRVGRKKTDNVKIHQALTLYAKGGLSVKDILFVSGISKTVFYRELKKNRDK